MPIWPPGRTLQFVCVCVCVSVCVCVCVCVCVHLWQPLIIILRNFWAALQTKEGGEARRREGGRDGGGRRGYACVKITNCLSFDYSPIPSFSLPPSPSLSLSLSLSLSASPSDCITAECEAAIHIHWRGTPAVFAAVSSLCIIFFFFRFSISIYLLPTLLLSQLPPISISSHLSPPLSTSVNPLSFSSLCLSSIFLFIVSLSFALYFVSLSIILALISLPAVFFSFCIMEQNTD